MSMTGLFIDLTYLPSRYIEGDLSLVCDTTADSPNAPSHPCVATQTISWCRGLYQTFVIHRDSIGVISMLRRIAPTITLSARTRKQVDDIPGRSYDIKWCGIGRLFVHPFIQPKA